jgi:hypothetical protein
VARDWQAPTGFFMAEAVAPVYFPLGFTSVSPWVGRGHLRESLLCWWLSSIPTDDLDAWASLSAFTHAGLLGHKGVLF